jgi:tetratricopeptide (TPR) repeat protein
MKGFRHLPKHHFELPEENSAITKIPPCPPLLKGGKFLLPLEKGGREGFCFLTLVLLITLAVFAFFLPRYAFPQATTPDIITSLSEKLEAWDVENAWQEMKGLLEKDPRDPRLLELASQIAFHRGEYQEALRLMKSAIEQGGDNDKRRGFALFIEESIGVLSPFKQYESAHFRISLDEKQDGILADYIIDALERTYERMARKYGFQPREKIRIEIFPDTRAFYYASTLSARDIEVTGAVGLAQFNKLMILSPKALVYGYRWLDAMSHEYMHYLIMKLTSNKAPIWFHEGFAKYEETDWRSGPSYLSPLYKTLLARALADGRLIRFERMEPSLIKLDTPEDVQLAYAQGASAIEFIVAKAGHDGLKDIMTRMGKSGAKGASEPIKQVMGLSFEEFETSWREHLASQQLKEVAGVNVRRYKIKEGKADEERVDMAEIKSMVARNKAHLGDLLKERGRMEAAVMEYRRALADTSDSVPVMNRLSDVLITIGRLDEALQLLKRARDLSPDHPTTHTTLGQTYLKLRDFKEARDSFLESIQISPFNPDVHQGLATAYEMLGEQASALKERERANRLGR